ncbi:hypothetical protein [Paracoccus mutanolyticus]|uniref:hypothetical protein n=1 Tax=Paracoccus mutanolyticus TaxID=1499308 RepID=UPI00294FFE62|nr:hypothetical protein [Paracoccus mutanolyticus]
MQAFAEASDIPVVAAFRYQDQFDNFSPVYVGEACRHDRGGGVGRDRAALTTRFNASEIIGTQMLTKSRALCRNCSCGR